MSRTKIKRAIKQFLHRVARLISPAHPDQLWGNVTYAQHGEDLVLLNIFRQLGIAKPCYLDIGAHHPQIISNTALLYERGCRGVNVEANPNLIEAFLALRPEDVTLNVAVGPIAGEMDFYFIDDYSGRNTCDVRVAQEFVSKHPKFSIQGKARVPVETVNNIYEKYFKPNDIDLLSIDVEGLDIEILKSTFACNIFPKVVVVEVDCGIDANQASDTRTLLKNNGYFIYVHLGANYVAIRHEYQPNFS